MLTITVDSIIKIAALITALGGICGAIFACFKFLERQKKQDDDINDIKKEQTLICFGVLCCLKGLKEQGCDGAVTDALNKMEKHLNEGAHKTE